MPEATTVDGELLGVKVPDIGNGVTYEVDRSGTANPIAVTMGTSKTTMMSALANPLRPFSSIMQSGTNYNRPESSPNLAPRFSQPATCRSVP